MVELNTLILLHGFGVRGFFWEPYKRSTLETKFHHIFTPDLDFTTLESAITSSREYVRQIVDKYGGAGPIFLVGHSLGGILAVLAAQELGASAVKKVIVIASPYGENKIGDTTLKIQRWLVKHDWLLPGFITRPRFFTKKTPKKIQKDLWKKVVKETDEFIDAVLTKRWFHTDIIKEPLQQESMVIASKHDKVVPFGQAENFAKAIGAKFVAYEKVGHNDFVYAPKVASKVVDQIITFLLD